MRKLSRICAMALAIIICASGYSIDARGVHENETYAATTDVSKQANSSVMEIHAIYPGENGNGDCVLIRSGKHYLLMDMGTKKSGKRIAKYLKKHLVKGYKLDLYVSHQHNDHGGGFRSIMNEFKIGTTYFYDGTYLEQGEKLKKDKNNNNQKVPEEWKKLRDMVTAFKKYRNNKHAKPQNKKMQIKFLNYQPAGATSISGIIPGSKIVDSFKVGSAKVTIIGAIVGHSEITKGNFGNNMSLVAKVEGGGMTYLTCGDIQENISKADYTGGQEIILADEYKKTNILKADIMKLSHHGLRRVISGNTLASNSKKFLELVRPRISFIIKGGGAGVPTSKGHDEANKGGNSSKNAVRYPGGEQSRRNANRYGFCYPVFYEKKNFKIVCKNGKAKMFVDGKQLIGLVTLKYYTKKSYIEKGKDKVKWDLQHRTELHYIDASGNSPHNRKSFNHKGKEYTVDKYGVLKLKK